MPGGMELNGKFFLLESVDYERLINLFQPNLSFEKSYRDYFFDFANSTLERIHGVLRLRVLCKHLSNSPKNGPVAADSDEQICASLVLKENNKVECGEQMLFVLEENRLPWNIVEEVVFHSADLLAALRRHCAAMPEDAVSQSACQRIVCRLEKLALDSNEPQPLEMHLVGSYATKRCVYTYLHQSTLPGDTDATKIVSENDMTEEAQCSKMHICVDKTLFPFGEKYELEIHNVDVPLNDVLVEFTDILNKNGVRYNLGTESKFSRFMKYIHGLNAASEYVKEVKLRIAGTNGYNEIIKWLDGTQDTILSSLPVHNSTAAISQVTQSTERYGYARGIDDLAMGGIYSSVHTQQQQQQQENVGCDISQRTSRQANLEYSSRKSVGRHEDGGCEERYQEDYYFDTPHSTLLEQHCFVRLRCLNHAESFIFSIKEKSKVENSEQECFTRRLELSGDVARELIQNPTQFLLNRRDHNIVANVLWEHVGVRSLRVVAFFRTERRVYVRRLGTALPPQWSQGTQQTYVHDDSTTGFSHLDFSPPAVRPSQISGPSEAHHWATVHIHVDRTIYDLSIPAEEFAAIAAASPSCSYSRAEGQVPSTEATELFEIELTNITNITPHMAHRWITSELNNWGIEWRDGIQRKVEQYFSLADRVLTQRSEDLVRKGAGVDGRFFNNFSQGASSWLAPVK